MHASGVTAQITPPPIELYPGIFWTIPGYNLEYTLGYSHEAPRLYPQGILCELPEYTPQAQTIPHQNQGGV